MDELLKKFAEILIDYSLEVKNKETIMIKGSLQSMPLVEQLYIRILEKGAFPVVRMMFDNQMELFYKHAKNHHLDYLSKIAKYTANNIDGVVSIMSSMNTKSLTSVDPEKQAKVMKSNRPISDIILNKKRWVLTLFPTTAYAQDAEMSLQEFRNFVHKALFLNKKNPISEWKKLKKYQEKVISKLKSADNISIKSQDTDLTLSVKNRKFINSCGINNMPSGEVFTGPIENSANGYIKFTFPACYAGREVDGVYLEFKNGKVVKAKADKNEKFLHTMLDMDRGSRYLGEFAFGLNKGIQKFIKNILFDEKIGGTIHMALGKSYEDTGGKNKSALHWDMIKDLRNNGEVYIDDKLFLKKGKLIF